MYAGTDEDKDQRRDDRIGDTYLRLQPLGILGIALVNALKEFLAVLDILRVCIDLIHQPIFLAVLFGRPVGNLLHKTDNILGVGGRHLHKIVLDLFHAVSSRFKNQFIYTAEIGVQIACCTAARRCQSLNARTCQTVFRIAFKALFHHFAFAFVVLFLCRSHIRHFLLVN